MNNFKLFLRDNKFYLSSEYNGTEYTFNEEGKLLDKEMKFKVSEVYENNFIYLNLIELARYRAKLDMCEHNIKISKHRNSIEKLTSEEIRKEAEKAHILDELIWGVLFVG